jgi:hypothetical protein
MNDLSDRKAGFQLLLKQTDHQFVSYTIHTFLLMKKLFLLYILLHSQDVDLSESTKELKKQLGKLVRTTAFKKTEGVLFDKSLNQKPPRYAKQMI